MTKINSGMFSSNSNDWETPQDLYDSMNKTFDFDLDPCASHENHKTKKYFTVEDDGLKQGWSGRVFMNPPYGRSPDGTTIKDWISKAYWSSRQRNVDLVVGLIPARTDTIYWHDYVMDARYIFFIKGRVHFSGGGAAPFPSAIIVWFSTNDKMHYPTIFTYDLKTQEVDWR